MWETDFILKVYKYFKAGFYKEIVKQKSKFLYKLYHPFHVKEFS